VLTIDPARRLATSLGLEALGNVESRVGDDRLAAAGVDLGTGELWAMMLDTKRTWDDLVLRFAADEAQARRIFANRYYQQISSALAGTQEFMAMEKLYELHESGRYDLLVLDTPPTRHALEFLDAPKAMLGFLDEGVLRFFTVPTRMAGRFGLGILRGSGAFVMGMLERLTGVQVLHDISGFVSAFSGMYGGFRDRASRVETFLREEGTAFVLVTSPNPLTVDEAIYFHRKLLEYRLPFGGFIVNRVHADALSGHGAKSAWMRLRREPAAILRHAGAPGAQKHASLAARLVASIDRLQALAAIDAAEVERRQEQCRGPHFMRSVPAFDLDVHDLGALARVNPHLFGGDAPRRAPRRTPGA
jgi:anion-transporting  ArsA/GET3 family ATPase